MRWVILSIIKEITILLVLEFVFDLFSLMIYCVYEDHVLAVHTGKVPAPVSLLPIIIFDPNIRSVRLQILQ
jgi:hypothetical protein